MARTKIDATLISPFIPTFIGLGRNRFINGEMNIDQQNGGAAVTANNATLGYSPDMFLLLSNFGGALEGVMTAQRVSASPPTGFTNYVRITVTTADAAISAANAYEYISALEGNNVRDLLFGTASAKTVTLSFWVRSSITGTFGGGVINEAQDRSYVFQYTINAANTWEYKTITVVGDTGGTWVTGTGRGVQLFWDMGAGSNSEGTANTWTTAAPARWRAAGNTRLISTAAATWDLTGVQFEIGSTASNFEYLPIQTQISYCQRYYEKTYDIDQAVGTNTGTGTVYVPEAGANATTVQYGTVSYKVPKRTTPTITSYTASGTSGSWQVRDNGGGINANGTTDIDQVGTTNFRIRITSITGSPITASSSSNWYIAYGHWVASARLQ